MPVNSFADYPMNWYPDKKQLKRPIYKSLLDQLKRDIMSGILSPGTKMPPQRELADYLDINFTTVTRVYKMAAEQGLLYARIGSGTFVSPNASEYITITLGASSGKVLDFGLVSSFEESNVLINDAFRQIAKRGQIERLTSYEHPTGMPYHKQMGLTWLRWLGLTVSEENMTIVSGGLNGLTIALTALFNPGDHIAVPQYCFSNFLDLARMLHIHLSPVPEDQYGILPEALEQLCRSSAIDGIYLMPTGSNPTCSHMTLERREKVVRLLQKYRIILLEDDTYAFLSVRQDKGYKRPLSADLPKQSVYVCSMSKCLCSGARIAYLAFPPAFRDAINRAFFNMDVKTSSIDAELISELLRSGKAAEIIEMKRKEIIQADKIYRKVFPKAPVPQNPNCYYRWLPIQDVRDGRLVEKEFRARGVQIYHSDRFLTGSRGSGSYIRISLSSAGSAENLEKGLKKIKSLTQDFTEAIRNNQ